MPPLLTADLRDSGLAHLTAVSGANVAIVVGAALLLARWAGVRGYLLVGVGLAVVVWFVLLARPQPSVLRAAVMGAIALVAVGTAGRTQAIRSLLACVVVLLLADPWLSRSWGFALSVAATAGLVVLARRWSGQLPERWPRAVRDAAAVALAAQVATLPLVVALAGQVAMLSVFANLLAAPAVAPATVLGAAAAAVSPVLPTLAQWLAWLGQWPAVWIAAVARHTASAPLATMPWPEGWVGGLLGLSGVVAGAGIWWVGAVRAWWRPRRLVALVVAAVAVIAAFIAGPGRWPPPGWVLVACDIGQGDALVVNLGDSAGLVVDAGPDPALVDRCLDRLGIEQVPLLVLTHFHADHVGGLPGVLDGRIVDAVLVSPLRDPPEQVASVAEVTRGMTVTDAVPGQTGKWGLASWRVLWPGEPVTGDGSAANNASVVLLVEVSGVRLLLTGDIEPEAQQALLQGGALPSVDVVKVPHHGSRYQDAEFLSAVGGRVAVVSAGEDNPYGHPAPELLAELTSSGMLVGRTDTDGSVAVVLDGGELRLVTLG
jgi:competence protein ComEC